MKSTRRAKMTAAVTAASVLAVCATAAISSAASAASQGTVSISVASLIPGSTKAATTQFNNQVKEFEKANPGIKVKSVQYQWTGPTFAAKLAAGTPLCSDRLHGEPVSPTAKTLGTNGQIARPWTQSAQALPYLAEVQTRGHRPEGTTPAARSVAVPTDARRCRSAALTSATSSRRPGSTRTARRRPGRTSRPTPRSSRRRPARPATPRWARTTTPPAGS